jgi:hypothetical protein
VYMQIKSFEYFARTTGEAQMSVVSWRIDS